VVSDHMTRAVRADDLEIFKMMDSKTLYSDIPARLRRYTADSFDDKYKRLDWESISRSITAHLAKDGYWYIHPEEHRTLTVREAARIQTFPDAFRFSGTRSDAFRQIGNAVPPWLGEAAARALAAGRRPAKTRQTDWLEARLALGRWAKQQRGSDHRYMLPGDQVTAPVAVAAAVMSGSRTHSGAIGDTLRRLRGLAAVDKATFEFAREPVRGTAAARGMERLLPLVRRKSAWTQPDLIPQVVGLKPAEDQIYELLRGKDVLLRSQGVLRVASRVAGSRSAEANRLTDGRIDLVRLVGSGEDAALRMAALRLISSTHCQAGASDCDNCPLAGWCRSAKLTRPARRSSSQR
jgi:DNA (cytosine-5)-methyltransferase 1